MQALNLSDNLPILASKRKESEERAAEAVCSVGAWPGEEIR